jgi:hypothetical protein
MVARLSMEDSDSVIIIAQSQSQFLYHSLCGFSPNPQKHLPNSFIHNSHAFLYCHNLFGVVVPLVRVTTRGSPL